MKHLLLSITSLLIFSAALLFAADLNEPAPDFTLKDYDGEEYALSDFKGKYVVLEWVNFGCPFVQKHYNSGNMQKLQDSGWCKKHGLSD